MCNVKQSVRMYKVEDEVLQSYPAREACNSKDGARDGIKATSYRLQDWSGV